MPINLTKGQKVDLTKGNPGLTKIVVGLGWDVNAFDSGAAFDLDAAAFMTNASGKCPTEKEFVFYGNLEHVSGAVKHMGDNLTGEGDGDDEQIVVDLAKVPANVERIAFTVTIYDAEARNQNFGQVSNSYIHIKRYSYILYLSDNLCADTVIFSLRRNLFKAFCSHFYIIVTCRRIDNFTNQIFYIIY